MTNLIKSTELKPQTRRVYAWVFGGHLCCWASASRAGLLSSKPTPAAEIEPMIMMRERDYRRLIKRLNTRAGESK